MMNMKTFSTLSIVSLLSFIMMMASTVSADGQPFIVIEFEGCASVTGDIVPKALDDTFNFYTSALAENELETAAHKHGFAFEQFTGNRLLRGDQGERRLPVCWWRGMMYSTCPACALVNGAYQCSIYCDGTGGELNCRRRLKALKKSKIDSKIGATCTLLPDSVKDAEAVAKQRSHKFADACEPRKTNLKVYSCTKN